MHSSSLRHSRSPSQRRIVHFALADDLAIARLQHKVRRPVLRRLALESGIIRTVAVHRGNSIFRALLFLVGLTAQNYLPIRRLQVEAELPTLSFVISNFAPFC